MEAGILQYHLDDTFTSNGFLLSDQDENSILYHFNKIKPDSEMIEVREDYQQMWTELEQHISSIQAADCDEIGVDLFADGDEYFPNTVTADCSPLAEVKQESNQEFEAKSNLDTPDMKKEPGIDIQERLKIQGKKIFGKNVINLYSLDELRQSEDCQVAYITVHGRQLKVIIKPKNQNCRKLTDEHLHRTLQKFTEKFMKYKDDVTLGDSVKEENEIDVTNEQKDEILTELQNGNYVTDSLLDNTSDSFFQVLNLAEDPVQVPHLETPRVPPLKIKLTGCKQESLLKSNRRDKRVEMDVGKEGDDKQSKERSQVKEKRDDKTKKKRDRIQLAQAVPMKKIAVGTRMQEAAVAISRRKLLKIVSGSETIQLDHDYCSSSASPNSSFGLKWQCEKNPKKDSGLESGEVSDASEEQHVVEHVEDVTKVKQVAQQVNAKLLEDRRRAKNHHSLTKAAAAYFRAANAAVSSCVKSSTDEIKTSNVSNGNKVLTNDTGVSVSTTHVTGTPEPAATPAIETSTQPTGEQQHERPKKKLKLEEYLSRRKESSNSCQSSRASSPLVAADKASPQATIDNCASSKEPRNKQDSKDLEKTRDRHRRYQRSRVTSSSSSGSRHTRSRSKTRRSRSTDASTRRRRHVRSRSRSSSSTSRYSRSSSGSSGRRRRSPRRGRRQSRSGSRDRSGRARWSSKYRHRRQRSPYRQCKATSPREKQKQIEERRVLYVGRIKEGTTNSQLRERFGVFGPIIDISVHFREHGDNYGFVTYAYKSDAYEAVEHGNDDRTLPQYDLCFGGRRTFCSSKYCDLDGMSNGYSTISKSSVIRGDRSFDNLLKEAQAKIKKRKS